MAIRQTILNEAPFTNYWRPDAAIDLNTPIASRVIQCNARCRLYTIQVQVISACTYQIYFTSFQLSEVLAGTAHLSPFQAGDFNADIYLSHVAIPICMVIAVTSGAGSILPIVTGV